MRIALGKTLLAAVFLVSGTACIAQAPASADSRIAAQNALFEDIYQAQLKNSPLSATSIGDYRYNDQLNDFSLAAVEREHAADVANLAKLKAISTAGMPEQDLLSHEIMQRSIEQRIANYGYKEYEMAVNQMSGPHLGLADLPNAVPLDSVKHYEDYIARLHQIPRAFMQSEEVLRAGMKDNLMPVKFLLEKIPAQCDGIVAADPFLNPVKKFPASIPADDQVRLAKAIMDAVNNEVLPAYKQFSAFIATEYAPHGRTMLAATSLPDGKARYQNYIRASTTTNLTPDAIHQIGLKEIDRIQGEMLGIAKKEGFADLASFRESLKTNPKYTAKSADQIVDDFRKYIAQMEPKLPELFTLLPKSDVTVEPIPAFQPGQATHYQGGTMDGKRPGRVSVQTADPTHRSMVDDEAVAYHEGVPGHHMQISVAQQLTGLPKFRNHTFNSGYIEGWALYAEQLGKEVGFYQDPVSDYGRLSSELFRAVRLVVDTGIHSKGWSRDQVVDFMRKTGSVDELTLQAETDRYIAWPAQALSYKLGQLKFRELRDRAQKELGPKFDIRAFHDEMLSGGVLPLDLLDARTNNWIAAQKAKSAAGN
ncbi:MAG: DUF885 domain-containing protein [Acidobacteriota bacterium]|nr:DUF885 domain-containing protein [Acidobacteriota bacterium]